MAKNKKTEDKAGGEIPWMQILISVLLAGILGAQFIIVGHLAGIEERNKDIEGMKSGIDKLLGRAGIAEITPTSGGTLMAHNVEVQIPPNSVSEPTFFRIEKVTSYNLPAALPKNYFYRDGFFLSSEGVSFRNAAYVLWDLETNTAGILDCRRVKILYWNAIDNMWQEITPESCSDVFSAVEFNTANGGYYVVIEHG